jgi:hypothetical protein
MTQAMDFEADEKLKLLTDALRAGPGSPEWRTAVTEVQAHASSAGEDEHQLLLRVREHLASGRSYREIRAGAGFTRKVIEGIEREADARPRMSPNANWIAMIAAAVIVGVVAVVAFMVWPSGPSAGRPGEGGLERTHFVETTESINFEDSIGADWQTFGFLTLTADGGLKPLLTGAAGGKDYRGGGIYWDRQITADEPVSVEATMTLQKGSGDGVVQLFVTDSREFETKSATSPHELVVYLKDGEARVALPDGSVVGQGAKLKDVKQNVDVRLAMNEKDAVVEVNQQRIWAGEHHLPAKPRTIGLRFLVAGNDAKDKVSVQSVRVMQTEKKEGSSLRGQGSGR